MGDAGVTVARRLKIPVTTGNSYTVATAIEATREAARVMGHDLKNSSVVVMGATGAIGRVCALVLAREARRITIVARNERKLEELAAKILYDTGLAVKVTSDSKKALQTADVVITVTSSIDTVIEPEDLKSGAVICDVARPRRVEEGCPRCGRCPVIEGGVVEVPGDVEFNLNFDSSQTAQPWLKPWCWPWSSAMRATLGRELTVEQVEEIAQLAGKHGFKLSGFRSFGKALTEKRLPGLNPVLRSGKLPGRVKLNKRVPDGLDKAGPSSYNV